MKLIVTTEDKMAIKELAGLAIEVIGTFLALAFPIAVLLIGFAMGCTM